MNTNNNHNPHKQHHPRASKTTSSGSKVSGRTSSSLSGLPSRSRFATAGFKLKKKQLQAVKDTTEKQHILADLLDAHPEWCMKVHISDLPSRANDSLVPVGFMVKFCIAYTLFVLIAATYDVVSAAAAIYKDQDASRSLHRGWLSYQNIYFHVTNAGTSSAAIVSATARYYLMRRPQFSDKVALALSILLVLPAVCTHILPAVVLYAWIYLPIIVGGYFIRRRMFRTRAIFGQTPYAFRVVTRALVFLFASWIMGSAYNLSCIYVYKSTNGPFVPSSPVGVGYLEALALEWNSRSIVCTVNNFARSLSSFVRNLATVGPVFS